MIAHIPLIRLPDGALCGHAARANPLAAIADRSPVTAVFQGPHAYISPTWYPSGFHVPTWNYAAVHAVGTIAFIDQEDEAWRLLTTMTEVMEGPSGWRLPDEPRYRGLLPAIRFFRIADPTFQAICKFNQNKDPTLVAAVIGHLEQADPTAAAFMRRIHLSGHQA